MNAPVLWIVLPIIAGIGLFFLRRWYRLVVALGTGLALFLTLLAWQAPINETIHLGAWSFKINETLNVLGRQFSLTDPDRPFMVCIYLMAALWFAATYIGRAGRIFVPLGFIITGLLTAALAVEPFLYAAMLVELAALVSVVLLSPPGGPVRHGSLRFLIFQTLGMPFILFTGWLLTGVEVSPGELMLVNRAAILLGIGFVLWLAIFPFHTWLPMVTEEAHPMSASFVTLMLPFMIMLFGLGFLDRYAWLRNAPQLISLLQIAGGLMVLTGGVWAAFQVHLGRILGFAVMVEIGKALLASSIPGGLVLFFALLLPRAVALAVYSLALSVLQSSPGLSNQRNLYFRDVQGLGRKLPLAAASLSIAFFSLAGLPLLAGFPVLISLLRMLTSVSIPLAILTLLGTAGLFISGLRSLAILVMGTDTEPQGWQIQERSTVILFLGIGVVVLLAIGLFPQIFLPPLGELARAFTHLYPAP